jgi:hypothetical protein
MLAVKRLSPRLIHRRTITMSATQTQTQGKREGDISDSFVSLSGAARPPLPGRFLDLKKKLSHGHESSIVDGWHRLLQQLRIENEILAREGSNVVPSVQFKNLDSDIAVLRSEIQKRGVAVIRGVIPEEEAREYKSQLEEYVRQNPSTRGE